MAKAYVQFIQGFALKLWMMFIHSSDYAHVRHDHLCLRLNSKENFLDDQSRSSAAFVCIEHTHNVILWAYIIQELNHSRRNFEGRHFLSVYNFHLFTYAHVKSAAHNDCNYYEATNKQAPIILIIWK